MTSEKDNNEEEQNALENENLENILNEDSENKNSDTYKILGDEMARLALKMSQNKADENDMQITYQDLANKTPNLNHTSNLKASGGEAKNKGKVKFGSVVKANTQYIKQDSKKKNNPINKNLSAQNSIKPKIENVPNDSTKKLSFNNNIINPSLKNSNGNIQTTNSVTNTNINSSRDPVFTYKNTSNQNNNINNTSNSNINKSNLSIVKNNNQANFTSKASIPKPSKNLSNNNITVSKTVKSSKQLNTNRNYNDNYFAKPNYSNNNTISNSRSNNSVQNNLDQKNNDTINTDELDHYEIEIINPEELEEEDSYLSRQDPLIIKNKVIINGGKLPLYEREMKNLRKKRNKLDKERKLIIQKKLNNLQEGPMINEKSHAIIAKSGEYVPIHLRAARIHNKHLTQIILNEELKRMEKKNQEDKEYEEIQKKRKVRKYEKEKWDNFVESCYKWDEEVRYKRKAAEIFKNRMEAHKPKINSKSKKIVKRLQKGNNSVDDVYTRLYNDYEEHEERKKILQSENMPPFCPKINKVKYFNKFVNKRKYNNTNNSLDRFVTDDNKNKFFLESQFKVVGVKINTKRIKNSENNKVNNTNNYLNISNEKVNYKKKKYENKYYRPTQETNISTIGLNTEGNTIPFSNRYVTTENPIFTESNQYYLPTTCGNNNFSDDKKNEISENNVQNQNYEDCTFKNNNYFADVANEEDIDFNNNNDNYSHYNQSYDNNNEYINYQNINNNEYNNYSKTNKNIINKENINNNDNKYENNLNNQNNNNDLNNNINNEGKITRNKNIPQKNNSNQSKRKNSDRNNIKNNIEEEEKNNKDDINNNIYINTNENNNESNLNCCIGDEQMFKDEEIYRELTEAAKKSQERQEKNGENESEKSEDDPLYRLNIRDTTPDNIKENVIIPSNNYQNFFNVEEIKEL